MKAVPDHSLQTNEDVEAILRIALRQEGGSGNELRDRLNKSAEELGIAPEALAQAEEQYRIERKVDRFMQAKRAGFQTHMVTFLSVNVLLHVIWALVMLGEFYWPGIVIASWGIGIVSHYFFMKQRPSPSDPQFQHWQSLGEPTTYGQDGAEKGVTVGVHVASLNAAKSQAPPEE